MYGEKLLISTPVLMLLRGVVQPGHVGQTILELDLIPWGVAQTVTVPWSIQQKLPATSRYPIHMNAYAMNAYARQRIGQGRDKPTSYGMSFTVTAVALGHLSMLLQASSHGRARPTCDG